MSKLRLFNIIFYSLLLVIIFISFFSVLYVYYPEIYNIKEDNILDSLYKDVISMNKDVKNLHLSYCDDIFTTDKSTIIGNWENDDGSHYSISLINDEKYMIIKKTNSESWYMYVYYYKKSRLIYRSSNNEIDYFLFDDILNIYKKNIKKDYDYNEFRNKIEIVIYE